MINLLIDNEIEIVYYDKRQAIPTSFTINDSVHATTIAYSGVSLAAAANSDVFEAKIATRMNVYESHGGRRDVHQYEV